MKVTFTVKLSKDGRSALAEVTLHRWWGLAKPERFTMITANGIEWWRDEGPQPSGFFGIDLKHALWTTYRQARDKEAIDRVKAEFAKPEVAG